MNATDPAWHRLAYGFADGPASGGQTIYLDNAEQFSGWLIPMSSGRATCMLEMIEPIDIAGELLP
jgi:hypothetical protein